MDTKYLPIGTIVKLNDIEKKVMIMGYYSVEYEGEVKLYDYEGCGYPEGLLLNNNTISFNHEDIEDVIQLGYIDDDYYALNESIADEIDNELSDDEYIESEDYE